MPTERISVTIDETVVERVRELAGPRGVSAFVDRALHHELARSELRLLLDQLEVELGPADEEMVAEAEVVITELERKVRSGSQRAAG